MLYKPFLYSPRPNGEFLFLAVLRHNLLTTYKKFIKKIYLFSSTYCLMYSINTSVMVVSFFMHAILSSSRNSLSMLIFNKTVDIKLFSPCLFLVINIISVSISLYIYVKI